MLCAEALVEAVEADDFSAKTLRRYTDLWRTSGSYREHRRSRNWHASFSWVQKLPRWLGWLRQAPWIANGMGVALLTGGRGLVDNVPHPPDHTHMKKLAQLGKRQLERARRKVDYDNRYTFDKATAVALAGSQHEVDQPPHLKVADTNVCATVCAEEYGNPCESFCPAGVYELIDQPTADGGRALVIHHENCVHCKTCDVADPYQLITWTTPEGGGGPDYTTM
jgi:electron-transferring-flavoprotein dehydrogenase